MKSFILLGLFIASQVALGQTIRIADNNINRPTGANVFGTLQAAIDAATDGDIVYIQPSATTYGDATVGKRITLKGVGFGVTELGSRSSTVGTLTLINSANGVSSISNTILTGFNFSTITFSTGGTGGSTFNNITFENIVGTTINSVGVHSAINNLTIRNCYFTNLTLTPSTSNAGTKIYNNIITGAIITLQNSTTPLITNNILFQNNYYFIDLTTTTINARIEHNIFSGAGPVFYNLRNQQVINNIFYGANPGTYNTGTTFQDNVFSQNLILGAVTMPPAANAGGTNSGIGNITGVAPQFINAPAAATAWSATVATYNYNLGPSSPCINAATTGDNIGPSGGTYPLDQIVKFRATSIPIITQFDNTGTVNLNQPLRANVKAKSN